MSISTYSELKTALTSWGKRRTCSTVLGDFIALAERAFSAPCWRECKKLRPKSP